MKTHATHGPLAADAHRAQEPEVDKLLAASNRLIEQMKALIENAQGMIEQSDNARTQFSESLTSNRSLGA